MCKHSHSSVPPPLLRALSRVRRAVAGSTRLEDPMSPTEDGYAWEGGWDRTLESLQPTHETNTTTRNGARNSVSVSTSLISRSARRKFLNSGATDKSCRKRRRKSGRGRTDHPIVSAMVVNTQVSSPTHVTQQAQAQVYTHMRMGRIRD